MERQIDIKKMIEHTLLKPEASSADVLRLFEEARQFQLLGVCIQPSFVPLLRSQKNSTTVKIITVVGFPLGVTSTAGKAAETAQAVQDGADEIDMVLHIGALKEGRDDYVREDIAAVVRAAKGRPVKVILETGLLSAEEKVRGCLLAQEAGAAFVKTCTGFAKGQAEVEDIRLMRTTVGEKMGVKASGGIKTREQALALVAAGANRLGTSSGLTLIDAKVGIAGSPLARLPGDSY